MTRAVPVTISGIAEERRTLFERLIETASGLEWCQEHSEQIDRAVVAVFQDIAFKFEPVPLVSIVATGGYGRREMSPYSDLDLTVIPLDDAGPNLDPLVRALFRALHTALADTLGIELGYAYRLINDAPVLDGKSRTGMLDARLVAGSPEPLGAFQRQFRETFPVGEFLIDKLRERREAFSRFHDTTLVVEPHLKEGAGGLRCFQCSNWIKEAIGEKPSAPNPAYDAVLSARNLLHFVAGKKLDVLSRQRQAEIADLTGRDPYELPSSTAEAMATLHGGYLAAAESLHEARFSISAGVSALRGEARVEAGASLSDAAAGISLATQLGLRVETAKIDASEILDGPVALHAVSSGEATLRNLHRCGLLERLLPELAACHTLMPTDSTHLYSVYEHTLRAIRILDDLEPGTYLAEIKAGLGSKGPLYLALLLHDAGKARAGTPHSESGERIAREVGSRWGLSESLTELVAWLVREHLTMARFIRVRDVQSPATAQEFAGIVGDPERLDLLTLLTYADIRAVSDEAWTPAQEAFLRELRERTLAVLEAEHPAQTDPALHRKRLAKWRGQLAREFEKGRFSEEEIEAFLESLPAHYLVATPLEFVPMHLEFAKNAQQGEPTVEIIHNPEVRSTDLTACCLDSPGLLSRLLGVLYAWDLTVEGLRVGTAQLDPPVALDTFTVSYGGQPVPPATCSSAHADLVRVMKGEADFEEILRARGRDPERKQEHFSYSFYEGEPGILEIQAPRGRGMAYRMSRLIARQGWNIVSARFGQWAGRGAAAFYIFGPEHRALKASEVDAALGG